MPGSSAHHHLGCQLASDLASFPGLQCLPPPPLFIRLQYANMEGEGLGIWSFVMSGSQMVDTWDHTISLFVLTCPREIKWH